MGYKIKFNTSIPSQLSQLRSLYSRIASLSILSAPKELLVEKLIYSYDHYYISGGDILNLYFKTEADMLLFKLKYSL